MKLTTLAVMLILAACGGGTDTVDGSQSESPEPAVATTVVPEATTAAPADAPTEATTAAPAEAPTEATTAAPESAGDTGIKLAIGDQTWAFVQAMCAYYDAPAGQPGSRWNVSAIQNGSFSAPDVQVYVNWEDPDTYLELYDFASDEKWQARSDTLAIDVNGNEIVASATFANSGTGETSEGSLSATCSSWVNAG